MMKIELDESLTDEIFLNDEKFLIYGTYVRTTTKRTTLSSEHTPVKDSLTHAQLLAHSPTPNYFTFATSRGLIV